MTWSIVAYDRATGAFGAAVATRAFAAVTFVPLVRSGVGAVGAQSITNRYLGPATLDGLERSASASRPEKVQRRPISPAMSASTRATAFGHRAAPARSTSPTVASSIGSSVSAGQ